MDAYAFPTLTPEQQRWADALNICAKCECFVPLIWRGEATIRFGRSYTLYPLCDPCYRIHQERAA